MIKVTGSVKQKQTVQIFNEASAREFKKQVLIIETFDQRSGEVGTQIDLYYNIKKGSALGGKYGIKLAMNYSYWAGLDAEYNIEN